MTENPRNIRSLAFVITLSVYYYFNNVWRINIISCVIRTPADYMAEWENVPLDPKTTKKKKQRVNLEPPRPMAARLINSFLSEKLEFTLFVLI